MWLKNVTTTQQQDADSEWPPLPTVQEVLDRHVWPALIDCPSCSCGSARERHALYQWHEARMSGFDRTFMTYDDELDDRDEGHGADGSEAAGVFNKFTATSWFADGHCERWVFDWTHYCEDGHTAEVNVTATRSDVSTLLTMTVRLEMGPGWSVVVGPSDKIDP